MPPSLSESLTTRPQLIITYLEWHWNPFGICPQHGELGSKSLLNLDFALLSHTIYFLEINFRLIHLQLTPCLYEEPNWQLLCKIFVLKLHLLIPEKKIFVHDQSRTSEANGRNSSKWTGPIVGLSKTLKIVKLKQIFWKILKILAMDIFIDRRGTHRYCTRLNLKKMGSL